MYCSMWKVVDGIVLAVISDLIEQKKTKTRKEKKKKKKGSRWMKHQILQKVVQQSRYIVR